MLESRFWSSNILYNSSYSPFTGMRFEGTWRRPGLQSQILFTIGQQTYFPSPPTLALNPPHAITLHQTAIPHHSPRPIIRSKSIFRHQSYFIYYRRCTFLFFSSHTNPFNITVDLSSADYFIYFYTNNVFADFRTSIQSWRERNFFTPRRISSALKRRPYFLVDNTRYPSPNLLVTFI